MLVLPKPHQLFSLPLNATRSRITAGLLALLLMLFCGTCFGGKAYAFAEYAKYVPLTMARTAAPAVVADAAIGLEGVGVASAGGGVVAACVASVICGLGVLAGVAIIGGGYLFWKYKQGQADADAAARSAVGSWAFTSGPTVTLNAAGQAQWSWSIQAPSGQMASNWKTINTSYYAYGSTTGSCNISGLSLTAGGTYTATNVVCAGSGGLQINSYNSTTGQATTVLTWGNTGTALTASGTGNPAIGQPTVITKDPGPSRTLTVTGTCLDATGGTVTATATSAAFHETDAQLPAIPPVACPAGTHLIGETVKSSTPYAGVSKTLLTVTPSPRQTDPTDPYADCMSSAGGTACVVMVYRVIGTVGYSCLNDGIDCSAFVYPNTPTTPKFECRWGTHTIGIAECVDFSQKFTVPEVDRYPETGGGPAPEPTATAQPSAQPTTSPGLSPNTCQDSPTAAVYQCNGTPWPGPAAPGVGGPQASDCAPSGWHLLDPLAYVAGMGCVLQMMFIPTQTTSTTLSELYNTAKDRPPYSVVAGIAAGTGSVVAHYNDTGCNLETNSPDFAPPDLRQDGVHLRLPCDPDEICLVDPGPSFGQPSP